MALNDVILALYNKIETDLSLATAEELAYLGTALEKIGGRATVYDVMQIGEEKKAELEALSDSVVLDFSDATASIVASLDAIRIAALAELNAGSLSGKAPLISPALTGIPVAPTAAKDVNTTQLATTAFVMKQFEPTFQLITSSYTAVSRDNLFCDTENGSFLVTLPLAPTNNQCVFIVDAKGTFNLSPLIVNGNGELIMGTNESLQLDVENSSIKFVYNSTLGWRMI